MTILSSMIYYKKVFLYNYAFFLCYKLYKYSRTVLKYKIQRKIFKRMFDNRKIHDMKHLSDFDKKKKKKVN